MDNKSTGMLEQYLSGEASKLLHQHGAAVLAKYGSIRPELEDLAAALKRNRKNIQTQLSSAKEKLDPYYLRFDPTSKSTLDDVSLYRFIDKVAGSVLRFITDSNTRLQAMERLVDPLLKGMNNSVPDLPSLMIAEESGQALMSTLGMEFRLTLQGFEQMMAQTYLGTRTEYKKLRKQFLGGTAKGPDKDDVEDQLFAALFGSRQRQDPTSEGPAIALVDDNAVKTRLFMDLADNLPRFYEKSSPVLKRGKLTGKMTTVKMLDDGEVADWASAFITVGDPTYWNYVNNPKVLTELILDTILRFQAEYLKIAEAIVAIVRKMNLDNDEMPRIIENPEALMKQYSRINFLAIRPSAEDTTPRNKIDQDLAVARGKLFAHFQETLESMSHMSRWESSTEEYAEQRIREAIELKNAMDDITRTQVQKELARNIADDNEFYVGKSGQLGSIGVEREPAPKIKYEDVVGESFVVAKQHVEEVIQVASHPYIMRLSAPRGNVKSNLLLIGPYGCHREGQDILMFDGTIKKVEDIVVGDQLMGPDSTPRIVQQLVRGEEPMVEITPSKGDSWVVNRNHILSLKSTQKRTKQQGMRQYTKTSDVVDVPVEEYLAWSRNKKMSHPLYRVGVEFSNDCGELPIDPYFLGVLLGDGCVRNRVSVTTQDAEIAMEVGAQAEVFGVNCVTEQSGDRTPSYHLTNAGADNPFLPVLRQLGLFGCDSSTKYVPHMYKTASRSQRLEMLAGLMDTDGHLHGNCFDYISKSMALANDVAFIARSLGLAAYVKSCTKTSQNGEGGVYYRVSISGDTDMIPVRLQKKAASVRKQRKNVLHVGFKTKELSVEKFFGFVVDKDHRYLLGDFTVTHNCGKTEIARAICADKRIIGFNVATADLLTAYMHESVKNIKRMFDHAKDLRKGSRYTKPVAITLDEFDRLFSYGEGVHQAYDGPRMTGVLQEMMDGILDYEGVFLVCMTNVPKAVPEAILRRFKYVDVVGQLTAEERAHLFRKFLTRGLPIDPSIDDVAFLRWAEMMDNAPGDVIGKVVDEIHFKYMHELASNEPKLMAALERTMAKKLNDRDIEPRDFATLKKALQKHKTIGSVEITTALDQVLKQPQVQMQINKAKQVFRDADQIVQGLSAINEPTLGFGAKTRSALWSPQA